MAILEAHDCNCEDYPCCGCGPVEVFTGADAVERAHEDKEAQDILDDYENDDDHETAMASVGHGTDDYGDFGPCSMVAWEDQFE